MSPPLQHGYFPAILCVVCDSPIDALVALCVRRDEAIRLVAAARFQGEILCLLTELHGGRPIVVLPMPDGRWAACNAYVNEYFATPEGAQKRLDELLRRGRQGYVAFREESLPARESDERQRNPGQTHMPRLA